MTPRRPDVAFELLDGTGPSSHPPLAALPPPDPEPDEVSLSEYLDVLVQGRWLVAAALALALAGGGAYALLATPIYRSDALVQVEDAKATKGLLGDLSSAFGESSPSETEIEILRSRALVGAVVKELRLEIVAEPRRFPLVGSFVARRHVEPEVSGALLGLASYGWGGERIRVDRLDVPRALVDERLTLVAGEGGRYTLLDPDGAPLLGGDVGVAAAGRDAEIFVSELHARPGLEFAVTRRDRDDTVAGLQEELRIAEKGKKTGMLRLALDGAEPARIAAILDALALAYVRQNVERRSAEARKTLEFLEAQLPVLRGKLEAAEGALEGYRSRKGSVDVTLEAQAAIARAVEIEKAASTVEVERAALREKFTTDHPAIVALDRKLRQLVSEREALDARLKKLPMAELESARLLRDVKVANELYLIVLNKAQELRVVKEGEIGNVRVLDAAIVPVKPVAPRRLAVLALSLLLGLGLGVAAAFGRRAFSEGVEDPEAVERATGVSVHASVPRSAFQEEAERRARGDRAARPLLLAVEHPKDLAIESLRSLRTSLQFALVESRNSVVGIGGPAPSIGKSFITANLAHLLGEAGKRVLVVDADLRRGQLHRHFGMERGRGLSDVIAGEVPALDAVRETGSANVSVLSTGTVPPNPAELLGSERFQRLLEELSTRHDLVLLDTPPVLAVTDAALVSRHAGVNLLVLRAGRHPMREIVAALRQLGRSGVRVQGIVMNDVRLDRGLGRRNSYHYQYKYE
jgi:tyrosine-protein kinase Etk/Wzc